MTLKAMYEQARDTPGDINEHVSYLKDMASQCRYIWELGVRTGVSTVALLSGKPARMTSVDIRAFGRHEAIHQALNEITPPLKWNFLLADTNQDLSSQMGDPIRLPCLTFIDTAHTYAQLTAELAWTAPRTMQWIVMHDTTTYATVDEFPDDRTVPGKAGLRAAIQDYTHCHPQWSIFEEFENNNGLTVLRRAF